MLGAGGGPGGGAPLVVDVTAAAAVSAGDPVEEELAVTAGRSMGGNPVSSAGIAGRPDGKTVGAELLLAACGRDDAADGPALPPLASAALAALLTTLRLCIFSRCARAWASCALTTAVLTA